MSKASGILGDVLGGIGQAIKGVSEASWNSVRTETFRQAETEAISHFHRCAKFYQLVCDLCWNKAKDLCLNCAPNAEVEIEAALNRGETETASENAAKEGAKRGSKLDVKRDLQLVCPECGAETHGAKFCQECGHKMVVKT